MTELTADERAELVRLREAVAPRRLGSSGRWVGACALLVVAAVLGGPRPFAVFVRGEVLDTETYVETVAPLASEPAVRATVAQRLADESSSVRTYRVADKVAGDSETEGAPADSSAAWWAAGQRPQRGSSTGRSNQLWPPSGSSTVGQRQPGRPPGVVTSSPGGQGQVPRQRGHPVTIDLGALLPG